MTNIPAHGIAPRDQEPRSRTSVANVFKVLETGSPTPFTAHAEPSRLQSDILWRICLARRFLSYELTGGNGKRPILVHAAYVARPMADASPEQHRRRSRTADSNLLSGRGVPASAQAISQLLAFYKPCAYNRQPY